MPVFRVYIVIFGVKIDLIGYRRRLPKLVTFTGFLELSAADRANQNRFQLLNKAFASSTAVE